MDKKAKGLLSRFLEYRTTMGYRDINGMRKNVKHLLEYLLQQGIRMEELKVSGAQAYQGWLIEAGYGKGTVENFIKGALAFYDYLKKKGKALVNPFKEIRRQRQDKRLPKCVLKEKEMNKLLNGLCEFDRDRNMKRRKTKYRLHVIAEVLYSTGLRINELANLNEDDIDFVRGVIEITDSKGGHRRLVFLNDFAGKVLYMYVKKQRRYVLSGNHDHKKLFGARTTRLLTILNEELKRTARRLKLPMITSHGFRHAVGYHFLRAGCEIRFIQEILGHKDIGNTEIYTKVDKSLLSEILKENHPRKWRRNRK